MATSPLEIRMAHLEGAYEQISERLGTVEERLASLEARFEDRMARLEGEFRDQFVRLEVLIENRIGRLQETLDARFARQDHRMETIRTELLSRMDRQFYWVITLVVLSILVPLSLRILNP
jgi:predicted  nucleic acid-binding Zn-ribbon protein